MLEVNEDFCRYIGHNAAILHKYANEDVSVGSWLVGLDVLHQDERRFCCDSDNDCKAQVSLEGMGQCLSQRVSIYWNCISAVICPPEALQLTTQD